MSLKVNYHEMATVAKAANRKDVQRLSAVRGGRCALATKIAPVVDGFREAVKMLTSYCLPRGKPRKQSVCAVVDATPM